MPEQKYISHSAEDCFGKRSNQKAIRDGLGGRIGSRAEALKQYNHSDSTWKKELKALKNQNKMLYKIAKKSVLCREINNIKKIRAKASKKRRDDSKRIGLQFLTVQW